MERHQFLRSVVSLDITILALPDPVNYQLIQKWAKRQTMKVNEVATKQLAICDSTFMSLKVGLLLDMDYWKGGCMGYLSRVSALPSVDGGQSSLS